MDETRCVYCGSEYRLEREHVIPVSWFGFRTYDDRRQWIVKACKDCNKLAGSKLFFSIPEKALYIHKRYKSKFRKILSIPYWDPKELSELDRKLRSSIEGSIMAKVVVQQKLAYIEGVSKLSQDYLRPEWVYHLYLEYREELKKKRLKQKRAKKLP